MPKRIITLPKKADSIADDDYIMIDGAVKGTRKILVSDFVRIISEKVKTLQQSED